MNTLWLLSLAFLCNSVGLITCQNGSSTESNTRSSTDLNTANDGQKSNSPSTTGTNPVSEATMKPLPTFQVPDDTYVVNDGSKICILLKLDAKFSFNYKKGPQKAEDTTDIALPDDVDYNGDCGNDKKNPEISLSWQNYRLKFTFNKNPRNGKWFVKNIQFSFTPSGDNTDSGKAFTGTCEETNIIAPLNMSYECSTPVKIQLLDEQGSLVAYTVLENIKVQAYANSDGSFGTEFPCPKKEVEDDELLYRSDTTPLAVGCTLAIITLLMVAGYGIYRSLFMKKVSYDTMDD